MKRLTLTLIVSLVSFTAISQNIFDETITFENNSNLVEIDTTQPLNIWQIGSPQKTFLDSAFSIPFAIVTDTIAPYPINNHSSFQVKIIPPPMSCWGIGCLVFQHKYDLEQNKDGGYIEVRYNEDSTWTNVIFDSEPEGGIGFDQFYFESDTIADGTPAFTGNSGTWKNSWLCWVWQIGEKTYWHDSLTIRFSVKTDSMETIQEGWLIDDIHLVLSDCTENISINSLNKNNSIIYPHPVISESLLKFENISNKNTTISIFDIYGNCINRIVTDEGQIKISSKDFTKGIYIYQISQNKGIISFGKFVVN